MTSAASSLSERLSKKTRMAFLWTGLFNEPLVGLFAILPFILRKDLHASVFQISILTTLKPLMALLSFYWSAQLTRGRETLQRNLLGAWLLARLPFLCFPFVDNVWFFICAAALYVLFQRAGTPAHMEILKLNVPTGVRERFFSLSSALNYAEGVLIGIGVGKLMHQGEGQWRVLFFCAALLGLFAVFIQMRVPILSKTSLSAPAPSNYLLAPWKESWELLKKRVDFSRFQISFMAGGLGLMLMAPAATLFYADILSLHHTEMMISRFVYMGLGFIISTPFWRRAIASRSLFTLTGYACLGFALCPLVLLMAPHATAFVYAQFFIYGIAQAGSHLIWHVSGPLFANQENSAPYTTVNILAIGLRGIIIFLTGGLLCQVLGAFWTLCASSFLCLGGSAYSFWAQRKTEEKIRMIS